MMNERERMEAERLLIASVLQHSAAIAAVLPLYERASGEEWCQGGEERWLLSCVMRYAREHGLTQPPSRAWLLRATREGLEEAYPADLENREARLQEGSEHYERLIDLRRQTEAPPEEARIWAMTLARPVRDGKLHGMLREVAERLGRGEIEEGIADLREGTQKVQHFLEEEPAVVSRLFEERELEADLEILRQRRDHPERFRGWLTGLTLLDAEMNGLHAGHMGCVVGKTGVGKSHCLRDLMVSGAEQGARVLYVSAEVDAPLVRQQLYSRLTGVPFNDLEFGRLSDAQLENLREQLRAKRESMAGEMVILDVPGNCSVSTVQSLMRAQNLGDFDLFFWDHLGLMTPQRKPGSRTEEADWLEQLAVSNEVREFSRSTRNAQGGRGVASWVAIHERNRASERAVEKIQATDINRASAMANAMSCMLHILRSTEMKAVNQALVKVTKLRTGVDDLLIKITTDLAHMRFFAEQEEASYGFENDTADPLQGF